MRLGITFTSLWRAAGSLCLEGSRSRPASRILRSIYRKGGTPLRVRMSVAQGPPAQAYTFAAREIRGIGGADDTASLCERE
jgi:hypothetical protein